MPCGGGQSPERAWCLPRTLLGQGRGTLLAGMFGGAELRSPQALVGQDTAGEQAEAGGELSSGGLCCSYFSSEGRCGGTSLDPDS